MAALAFAFALASQLIAAQSEPIRILPGELDPGRFPEGEVLEACVVEIDLPMLRESLALPGHTLTLPLPEGTGVTVESDGARVGYGGSSWTVTGTLTGDPLGRFALVARDGLVAASLRTGAGGVYTLRPIAGGRHAFRRVRATVGADCPTEDAPLATERRGREHPVGPPPADDENDQELSEYQEDLTIDLLAIYTNLAAQAFSDQAGDGVDGHLLAWLDIELGVTLANVLYIDSAVALSIRLCGLTNVDHQEAGESIDPSQYPPTSEGAKALEEAYDAAFQEDLNALADPADPLGARAATWRDVTGADVVTMVIKNPGFHGLAKALHEFPSPSTDDRAFSVIWYTRVGQFTLAHEVGHNLGCHHDNFVSDPWQGAYVFSRGHHFVSPLDGIVYRTVMAYSLPDDVVTLPQFWLGRHSNPLVDYHGVPTGASALGEDPADNALTVNLTAPFIAAYRPSATLQPVVWVDPINAVPGNAFGTFVFPYPDIESGLLGVAEGGVIRIAAGTSVDVPIAAFPFPTPKHVVFDVEGVGSVLVAVAD